MSVIVPVGIGFPLAAPAVITTLNACAVVMLVADGTTVMMGDVAGATATVTVLDPVAEVYVAEHDESGVNVTVRIAVPDASEPAGMLIVAAPLLRTIAEEVYAPLESFTDPVKVGFPDPPLTITATESGCAVVIEAEAGVTAIVGVIFVAIEKLLRNAVTSSDPSPVTSSKPTPRR